MNKLNQFRLLVVIIIVAPAMHYFIAGKDQEHTLIRNILVIAQIGAGLLLLLLYGRKRNRT